MALVAENGNPATDEAVRFVQAARNESARKNKNREARRRFQAETDLAA
ncbi:hypothetical protein AB4Y45_23620 [Paraburkholderia sp. EG287A]